jgi:hypothetical protein
MANKDQNWRHSSEESDGVSKSADILLFMRVEQDTRYATTETKG